jgi:histidinol-phosphate aminotransferase
MSRYWSTFVHDLVPYTPGEQPKIANLVKLNTNENPYGPSPKVLAAMQAEVGSDLRLYPDPDAATLKQTIARYYQVAVENVFVGNGSDEVLAHIFYGLLQQSQPVLFPDITYSFYPVYCGLYQQAFRQIPLDENFSINIDDYASLNGGIIFPNPNAPTGVLLPLQVIETLLQRNTESVVVIDEAYIDFGGESAIPLTKKYANVLVVQTLSKSRSLAGLRVGFAIGHADLIAGLERIKNSFNSYPLSRIAIAGAAAAFDDEEYFQQITQQVIHQREQVVAGLEQLGFTVLPSAANFVFAKHAHHSGAALAQALRERAVLVRHFKGERTDNFLRISIGTEQQNQQLLQALAAIMQ